MNQQIKPGDFIQSQGLAVRGFVMSKGVLVMGNKKYPAYQCDMGDKTGYILESEAVLLWPAEEEF